MPKGRILAVDDQRYFRELLEGMLVEEGFEVQTASGGREAIGLLERSNFDVVLTDLVMPEMDGNEFVHRVKQSDPDQDVVVVTGVVDVKTAVDSMKLGASEYLLKPFDRETLATTLEGVLHRRRLRIEHARLLAENIEFMGERTLIERAMALYSFLSTDVLSERIVDGLCVETGAQGGILWIAGEAGADSLGLVSARGLVRVDEEPQSIAVSELPSGFREGTLRSKVVDDQGNLFDEGEGILLVLRDEARVSGLVRLTDKLGGERFNAVDRSCAEKFVGFAQTALVNAKRFEALEHRHLEPAATEPGSNTIEHFENAVCKEIEKSARHGRTFSILEVAFTRLEGMRSDAGERAYRDWLADVIEQFSALQRSTDVLSFDGEGRFMAMLPDADALGATILRRRAGEIFESVLKRTTSEGGAMAGLAPERRPQLSLAVVTYPADGTQLEGLMRLLAERGADDRKSLVRELQLATRPLAECLNLLLERGFSASRDVTAKIGQLILGEPQRASSGRTLLYTAPGRMFADVVSQSWSGSSRLADSDMESDMEIEVLSDEARPDDLDDRVRWVMDRGPHDTPYVVRLGEGPAYALICDDMTDAGHGRLFHTADRSLVEHLAFRVQRRVDA
jgi:CheY-like chemotaxis protein